MYLQLYVPKEINKNLQPKTIYTTSIFIHQYTKLPLLLLFANPTEIIVSIK